MAHATLQNYQTLSSSGESESLSVFKVKAPKNKKIVPVLVLAYAKVGIELLISNRKELLIKGVCFLENLMGVFIFAQMCNTLI